jgi:hypothetical protein
MRAIIALGPCPPERRDQRIGSRQEPRGSPSGMDAGTGWYARIGLCQFSALMRSDPPRTCPITRRSAINHPHFGRQDHESPVLRAGARRA